MKGIRLARLAIAVFAAGVSGCGTQINTLRSAASTITSGAGGVPPIVTSFALTDTSPTRNSALAVSWGVPVGGVSQYCLLENSTDALACVWHSGALPTSYVDSAADGPFALTAYLKNAYGVSAPITSNTITLDRTAPTLASAVVGNSDPTNDPTFALSYGAIGFAPYVEYCMQENNTSSAACTWTAGALPATFGVSPTNGSKAISIWLRDAAGNVSGRVTTAPILFDGSVPLVAFTSPAAGSYANIANASAFPISGTCSENGRNVVISGAASATLTCAGGAWSTTVDVSAVGSGPFTLYADTTNAAGTPAVQASRSFNEDSTAPTVAITAPAAGTVVGSAGVAAFAISGTCSENGRNVVVSGAGSATVACAGGAWSTTVDVSGGADGTITLRADHSDVAGNPAAQDARNFVKDTGAPTVAIASPAAGSYVNSANVTAFAVGGTCSENGRNVVISGAVSATTVCAAGAWSINLDFSAAAEGSVTVDADHSDAAGNAATQDSRAFTKDTTAPTLASMTITNSDPTTTTTYGLSYGAQSGSFSHYCILENSTAVGGCSWTASASLPASFTVATTENAKALTIWLRDAAGNASASVTSGNSVTYDVTGPAAATSLAYQHGPLSNEASGNLTWTKSTSGDLAAQWIQTYSDGACGAGAVYAAWTDLASTTAQAAAFGAAPDGTYSFQIKSVDAAGNETVSACSYAIRIDLVPPTLAGVDILNVSPTPSRGYLLAYTGPSEAISQYCILENDTTVGNCSWVTATSLPASYAVTATQNAKTLTVWVRDSAGNEQVAGRNSDTVTYSNVLAISPSSVTLASSYTIDSFDGRREGHVSVLLDNGKLLVAGGCNHADGYYYSIAKLYDPATDTWSSAGNLSRPRCDMAFVKLADGRVLVAGGSVAAGASTATVEIYDPTANAWRTTYPMATARSYAEATLLANGKVLVTGGFTDTNSAANTQSTTEIYDPATEVWIPGPAMNSKRQNHRAVRLASGKVLIVGGSTAPTTATATSDVFTASGHSGTIAAGPAMAASRSAFGLVALSAAESPTGAEAALAIAGYNGNATYRSTVELYNGTGWVAKTSITGARRDPGVLKLADGTVFVGQGYDGTNYLITTGNYAPLGAAGAGTWTAKDDYVGEPTARAIHHQLPGGTVISTLGETSWAVWGHGNIHEYNPATNVWSENTRMPGATILTQLSDAYFETSSGKIITAGHSMAYSWQGMTPGHWRVLDMVARTNSFTGPLPGGLQYQYAAPMVELDDGRVIRIGGCSGGCSNAYNKAAIYDPTTNAWTETSAASNYSVAAQSAKLPGNRVMRVGGRVGSGFNNATTPTAKTHIYDVAANTWSVPASADLPSARTYHRVITTPSGRIFLYGGRTGSTVQKTLFEWNDAATSWTAKASSSGEHMTGSVTYVPGGADGRLLVVGGFSAYNDGTGVSSGETATAEIYDIGTDAWSAAASLPATQAHLCATYSAVTNEVFLVGNYTGAGMQRVVQRYSVSGNAWTTTFNLADAVDTFQAQGQMCGTHPDGNPWFGVGERGGYVQTIQLAAPVQYTATQGDGNYAFSITAGAGWLDARNVFYPALPLASGASTTIRVDDGGGQNASATASVP